MQFFFCNAGKYFSFALPHVYDSWFPTHGRLTHGHVPALTHKGIQSVYFKQCNNYCFSTILPIIRFCCIVLPCRNREKHTHYSHTITVVLSNTLDVPTITPLYTCFFFFFFFFFFGHGGPRRFTGNIKNILHHGGPSCRVSASYITCFFFFCFFFFLSSYNASWYVGRDYLCGPWCRVVQTSKAPCTDVSTSGTSAGDGKTLCVCRCTSSPCSSCNGPDFCSN